MVVICFPLSKETGRHRNRSAQGARVNVYGYAESTGKNIIKSLQRAGGATVVVSHTDRGDPVFDKKGRQIDRWSAESTRTFDGWIGANQSGFGFETSGNGRYESFGKIGAEFVCLFSCALAQRTLDGYRDSLSSPSAALIMSDGGADGLTIDSMDVEFAIAAAILIGEGEEAESIASELQTLNDKTGGVAKIISEHGSLLRVSRQAAIPNNEATNFA